MHSEEGYGAWIGNKGGETGERVAGRGVTEEKETCE